MALVAVGSFREPYEAHLARSLLETEGIDAFVAFEHHVGLNWLYSSALGGVRLHVPAADAERARELLAISHDHAVVETDAEVCPECGRVGATRLGLARRLRAVSLAVGVPISLARDYWVCPGCGHRWRDRALYARPLDVAADLFAFLALVALGLARLPARLIAAVSGSPPAAQPFLCWACRSAIEAGQAVCPGCGTQAPPERAFEEILEPGKLYDHACSNCHTPYAAADYRSEALDWRCSLCHSPLDSRQV
jgi:RNA polymerase subunit RPABC4/transcription elongation factor Spt4